jgi:CRP-like cAMP-binding protein
VLISSRQTLAVHLLIPFRVIKAKNRELMFETLRKALSKHITLTDDEFDAFVRHFTLRKYRKKQYVLQQGDICRHLFYVVKGCIRSFEVDDTGKEHIIQFSIEDWWVGDMESSTAQIPSRLNIECLENCELLFIEQTALERLYIEIPKLERFFRIIVQNAFMVSQRRLLAVMSKTALERYLEFTERYPQFMERIPNHHIASYLGIAPESLSRLRKEYATRQWLN